MLFAAKDFIDFQNFEGLFRLLEVCVRKCSAFAFLMATVLVLSSCQYLSFLLLPMPDYAHEADLRDGE